MSVCLLIYHNAQVLYNNAGSLTSSITDATFKLILNCLHVQVQRTVPVAMDPLKKLKTNNNFRLPTLPRNLSIHQHPTNNNNNNNNLVDVRRCTNRSRSKHLRQRKEVLLHRVHRTCSNNTPKIWWQLPKMKRARRRMKLLKNWRTLNCNIR